MKSWITLPLVCAAIAVAAPVSTADDNRNVKVGARAGTLGFGPEVGVQLHKRVNFRASITGGELTLSEEFEGVVYDGTITVGAAGAQVDLFPMFGGLYITGGAFANDNALELIATPAELTFEIGGATYSVTDVGSLTADVGFSDFVGYAGVGWTGRFPYTMVEAFMEAGAYLQGAPTVEYTATGLIATDPNFIADLLTEAEELEEELAILETYPSVNVGLRVRF